MLAGEWIDYFIANTSAAVTREAVRQFINIAQNQILSPDTDFMRVVPDPYFMTEDETYSYVVNNSVRSAVERLPGALVGDIRAVKYVYTRNQYNAAGNFSGSPIWGQYWRTPLRWRTDELGGFLEAPVTGKPSKRPMTDDLVLTWNNAYNPGESTLEQQPIWNCRVYLWPTQVLSENVELALPEEFLFNLLFEAVSMLVERPAYGSAPYPTAATSVAMKKFVDAYSASTLYSRPRNSPAINA